MDRKRFIEVLGSFSDVSRADAYINQVTSILRSKYGWNEVASNCFGDAMDNVICDGGFDEAYSELYTTLLNVAAGIGLYHSTDHCVLDELMPQPV